MTMQPVNCSGVCQNCDKLKECVLGRTLLKMDVLEREIKELKLMLDRRSNHRYGRVS